MDWWEGGFILLGLVDGIIMFLTRNVLSNKIKQLRDVTGLAEWKAWRLAVLEPVVTTFLAVVSIVILMEANTIGVHWVFTPPLFSMLLFTWLIKKQGERCQRGRLANSIIRVRITLVFAAMILAAEWTDSSLQWSAALTTIALILRQAFILYMNHVTPTLAEYDQEWAAANIHIPAIEDGLGEFDLWDEQVALIERLKAEEVTAVHEV